MSKQTKKFFTIHKNDAGREAYREEYVQQLEQLCDERLRAIQEFARGQDWAADIWKRQPHIKRLFDLATRDEPKRPQGPANTPAVRVDCAACNVKQSLQWLVDDMTDAGEDRNPETGEVYDSVAAARKALNFEERQHGIDMDV
jgi:hypothetical protein